MGWMIGGSSPGSGWEFSLRHRVQNGSAAHPASYPMGTRGSFPGGVKLTTHLYTVPKSRMRRAILPLAQYAFMARCSVKKHRNNFTFTLLPNRLGTVLSQLYAVHTLITDHLEALLGFSNASFTKGLPNRPNSGNGIVRFNTANK
jgi:hypothetical protein